MASEGKEGETAAKQTSVFEGYSVGTSGLRLAAQQYVRATLIKAIKTVRSAGFDDAVSKASAAAAAAAASGGAGAGAGAGSAAGGTLATRTPVVLVVDSFARTMLASLFSVEEVLGMGFIVVEPLSLPKTKASKRASRHGAKTKPSRQPYPNFHAVYMLRPQAKALKKMIADYDMKRPEPNPEDVDEDPGCLERVLSTLFPCIYPTLTLPVPPTRYNKCALVALAGTNSTDKQHVLSHESGEAGVVHRFRKAFVDVILLKAEYQVPEANLFSLDVADACVLSTSPSEAKQRDVSTKIARRLATVCYTLNEFPVIRVAGGDRGKVTRLIADHLSKKLETWSDWRRKTRQKTRATLLLVDRYEDVLTPLMHDFTYQALYFEMPATSPFQVFDYIDSNDEHNDVLLNEDDPVWVRLRHQHIAMAAPLIERERNLLAAKARELLDQRDKLRAGDLDGAGSQLVNHLVVADNMLMKKIEMHYTLVKRCFALMSSNSIEEIAAVEQALATGRDDDNKKLKKDKLRKLVKRLIGNNELYIDTLDLQRLMALFYASCDKDDDGEREKRLGLVDVNVDPEIMKMILNLAKVDFDMSLVRKLATKAAAKHSSLRIHTDESELKSWRYEPLVVSAATLLAAGDLPTGKHGYLTAEDHASEFFKVDAYNAAKAKADARSRVAAGMTVDETAGKSAVTDKATSRRKRRGKKGAAELAAEAATVVTPGWAGAGAGAGAGSGAGGSSEEQDYNEDTETIIVCFTGGITFTEAAALERLASKLRPRYRIFYGGTDIVTPAYFLQDLEKFTTHRTEAVAAGAGGGALGTTDIDLDI